MRRISIIIFVFSAQVCLSQTYLELPDSNAKWINIHRTFTGNPANVPTWQIQYCATGEDTVLQAKSYFKVDTCGGGYKGAMRNDNGKVFFFPKDSANEFLLYDFTVNEGDTVKDVYFENPQGYPVIYDLPVDEGAVDSILLDGIYRKRIVLGYGRGWIEGIGNSQGLFWEPWGNISGYGLELYCMSSDNATVYPDASFGACENFMGLNQEKETNNEIQVFPNPTRANVTVKLNTTFESLHVLDARGYEMISVVHLTKDVETINLAPFPSGIYLVVVRANNQILTKKIVKE